MTLRSTLLPMLVLLGAAAAACSSSDTATTTSTGSTSVSTASYTTATTTTTTGAGGAGGSTAATTGAGGAGGGTCTSMMYAKYTAAAFTKVTNDLVMTAAADAQVGHYFSALDSPTKVSAFEASLDQFLVKVYGGPDNYAGPDMVTAHTGLMITSADYDYFVGLIVKTLMADGVSAADITNCFAPPVTDPTFKASIVGK